MKYTEKSFSVSVSNPRYEEIFGHKPPSPHSVDVEPSKSNSTSKKNRLYKQALEARSKLRDVLCTKNECAIPNERNVQKMLNSEFKNRELVDKYKNCMKAIGADPRDADPERIRRA